MDEDREELLNQEAAPKSAPAYTSRGQQRRRQRSVFQYITILFAAALVLLLYTFMMERRQSQQQIDDLKQSNSAAQTLQGLINENSQLKTQVKSLEDQIKELEGQLAGAEEDYGLLRAQLQGEEKSTLAMHWFWQINEAYVRGKTKLCRELIADMENQKFQNDLPRENVTGTDRFSPYDRYMEIRNKVIK